jgi:hypothetical protein
MRLRNVMPSILNLPSAYFGASYDRETVPEMQSLLKFDGERVKYSLFPPIFFPGRKKDMKKLFKTPILPRESSLVLLNIALTNIPLLLQMLKALLFGASSLGNVKRPSPKTLGVLWKLNTVTAGSISFIAIMVS